MRPLEQFEAIEEKIRRDKLWYESKLKQRSAIFKALQVGHKELSFEEQC